MLTATKNGITEPITKFNNYEQVEEVNGAFTLSFTSFFNADNHGHDLIENESIVEDNGYTFRVKQSKKTGNYKNVTAISTYFDNIGKRKYDTYGGTHTFNDFMTWVLSGTGWTFTNVDITDSYFIPNFGSGNVVELVQTLLAVFNAQMKIGQNNTLIFAKQIGADNDAQYRYGFNVTEIYENTDTSNLRTVIKGFGANGLEVTYTSPNAATFGNIEAEPITDDRFTDANSLTERIKQELIDYPETSIELNAIELEGKELGERVWLIHERLGVEFQTQVLAIKRRIPATLSTVVIGNRLPRTLSDALISQRVEIDQNKKQTQSRFEQTNDRITLEVERIDDSIATIELQADNIELSVQSIDGRLGTAESNISIQAGQITQKVSYTDYNGNEIASRINQNATTITLDAAKINLLGITNVANDLNIGSSFSDGVTKGIYFRGVGGGARIVSGDNFSMRLYGESALYLSSFGTIFMDGDVDFGNNNVTGLTVSNASYATSAGNADTLGGYSASSFSFSGHTHSGSEYVKPQVAQTIELRVDNSLNRLYVYNGANSYYVNLT